MLGELAVFEMCEKVVVGFPDVWRANVIDVKPVGRSRTHKSTEVEDWGLPVGYRLDEAIEEISERCSILSITQDQWVRELRELSANEASQIILEACLRHGQRMSVMHVAEGVTEFHPEQPGISDEAGNPS